MAMVEETKLHLLSAEKCAVQSRIIMLALSSGRDDSCPLSIFITNFKESSFFKEYHVRVIVMLCRFSTTELKFRFMIAKEGI